MAFSRLHRAALASTAVLALLGACATPQPLPTTDPAALKSPRPGFVPGYMERGSWVDSLALLPPPPAAGSPALAADEAAYKTARAQQNSPRWAQAARDERLAFPAAAESFACAMGLPIAADKAPHLTMLMRRTLADAGLATYRAKDHYKRSRPFMVANDPTCKPDQEAALRKDGSYPSGHAAVGWAWALVLTEVAPERADALAQRGRSFGDSRMACGAHWASDVDAGRLVASAVVAQLHANADFRAQLDAAKGEVAAMRAAGAKPNVDCAAESAALANR
jgi:acid phosphatase (class A)